MATNVKAKKKKGTYDNKLIIWIAVGLVAFVGIVVGIFAIVNYNTNYVAKVDGLKIYTYEYDLIYRRAAQEYYSENFKEPDNYDDLTTEERNKLVEDFYTDEVYAEISKQALEDARQFKASYRLAVDAGFKLTSDEKVNIKTNIDYMYSYYESMYSGVSSSVLMQIIGASPTMSMTEFKSFSLVEMTIEKYKNHLKEAYDVTEEEMRDIYDGAPNDYRTLSSRVYMFSVPTKPTVPKDDDGNEIAADTTDATLKEKYDEYLSDLDEYEKQIANYLRLASEMKAGLDEDGKYTLYSRDMTTYEIKTEEKDGETQDIVTLEGTFEELCTSASSWSSASTNKGVVSITGSSTSVDDEIKEYILQIQWNADRTGFIFVQESEEVGEDKEEEDDENTATSSSSTETEDGEEEDENTPTPSELKIIEVRDDDNVLTALYIVRVEDITDFDTELAEDSEEEYNTVQSTIRGNILEERAVAELEQLVADKGSKFDLKINQNQLDEVEAQLKG